jgi:hypothetical protein
MRVRVWRGLLLRPLLHGARLQLPAGRRRSFSDLGIMTAAWRRLLGDVGR